MAFLAGKVAAQSVGKHPGMGQTVAGSKPVRGTGNGTHTVKVNESKRQRRSSIECSATVASSAYAEQEVDSLESGPCHGLLKQVFSDGSTQCLEVHGDGGHGFVVNDAFMECVRRQQEQQQRRIRILELENEYLRNYSGLGDVGLGFPVNRQASNRDN